ncbi:MAG: phosphoribosylanthranilate isomerase, partial [Gammaproteobacteria bacterium]|nr:phosphoribosylanthranilate isomerase [Gammaproteobacteria bacterium]
MNTFIKICGLRSAADVAAAVAAGANAVGFVFSDSVRKVTPAQARQATANLDVRVRRVAVMRHPDNELCRRVIEEFAPDVVQTDADDFGGL